MPPTEPIDAEVLSRRDAADLADAPVPTYGGAAMTRALQKYKELQDALDKAMPDAIMDLEGRKFRKKSYWRAVATAFNLTVEMIDEAREVVSVFADGRENFGWRTTYRATATLPNGTTRSVLGDGSCFAVEKARRFRCPHPEESGRRAVDVGATGSYSGRSLHFPHESCPDFDPEFQYRVLPPQATEHNIRSHAHTRAFNRAISNLVGFGEVSAEEVARDETGLDEKEKPHAHAVRADGSALVVSVEEKSGVGKGGKPWTRFGVTFDDGRAGSTFDAKIAEKAQQAKLAGALVVPDLKEDGRYVNLLSLTPAAIQQAEPEHPDTEPVGEPEKILAIRHVEAVGDRTAYDVIQTDHREYVTERPAVSVDLAAIKTANGRVIVEFKTVTATKGGKPVTLNVITAHRDAAVAAPATGPAPTASDIKW